MKRPQPQIRSSEEGAGMDRCGSPFLHPQIQPTEEGAGATRRIRRHRGKSPAAPEHLPFNEDMLREIFLRLPSQPSCLLRASAVCKRWRSLLTESKFLRLFRAHHRKPPILGVFVSSNHGMVFRSILDPPDRIPAQRFDLGRYSGVCGYYLLDCLHGCLLFKLGPQEEVFVCDPMSGQHRRLVAPPEFVEGPLHGAVLCASGDHGHVHGGCHLDSYKVVLVSTGRNDNRPLACVYSLETGLWGNLISSEAPSPLEIYDEIIQAEDGAVGFALLDHHRFQIWQRNVNCDGVATWVPWKTIEMHSIFGRSLQIGREISWLLGYDEDNDVIFVYASRNVYAVQLKSMQSKKLYETNCADRIHPLTSFYAPGTAINGGSNGAEMLHDT
ncbi:unnamed protein product [Alopecurus aequalis]